MEVTIMKLGQKLAQVIRNAAMVYINGYIVSTSCINESSEFLDKNDLREDYYNYYGQVLKFKEECDDQELVDLAKEIVAILKAGNLKPAKFTIEGNAVKSVEF